MTDQPAQPEHVDKPDDADKPSDVEQPELLIAKPTRDDVHAYFQPYRRISPPWTLYERLKTAVVLVFIFPFRLLYMLFAGLLLFLISTLALVGVEPSEASLHPASKDDTLVSYEKDSLYRPFAALRKGLLSLIFPLVRSVLFVSFGVFHIRHEKADFSAATIERKRQDDDDGLHEDAFVIVANHLGYIDILVLLSKFRGSFVAKGECERTILVGLIARALQCMFVRQGQSLTTQLINRVQSTHFCHKLRKTCGNCPACMIPLVIFPEGTTANGTAMIPFRTGVFNAGVPVKPVCISFPHKHFNMSWETIRFREHVFRTMTQFQNHVHITELPVYVPSEEEAADARLYSSRVQAEMAQVLDQTIIPLNRKHKFLYHSYILGKEKCEKTLLEKADKLSMEDEQISYFKETDMQQKA